MRWVAPCKGPRSLAFPRCRCCLSQRMSASGLSFGKTSPVSLTMGLMVSVKQELRHQFTLGIRDQQAAKRPLLRTHLLHTFSRFSAVCGLASATLYWKSHIQSVSYFLDREPLRSEESHLTHRMRCIHVSVLNLVSTSCALGQHGSPRVLYLDGVRLLFYSL